MPKYALLIGVSSDQHTESLKPFPSAKRNVEAMGRILMIPEVGGFADVQVVFDPDPMQMQEAVEEFLRQRSPHDLALLFFSGQMARDERGKLYFATRLTRHTPEGSLVKYTAVPAGFVQEWMGSSLSRQQVMILDCGIGGTPPTQRNGVPSLQSQLGGENWAVLLSSSSARPLPEHNGSDLSLYTHYLVEGMATGAADLDRDGLVSVQDLHTYIAQQVRQVTTEGVPQMLAQQETALQVAIARVPVLDSRRQYREKVRQSVVDGGLSPVGRTILDWLRLQLGLSAAEALALETEVLQPFREQWENAQKYQRALEKALETQYPLGDRLLRELRELQDLLAVAADRVAAIHETVIPPFAARAAQHQQRRSHYQRHFEQEISRQWPLAEAARQRLQRLQSSLHLSETEVSVLEAAAIAHYQTAQEARQRHQQQYREALLLALETEDRISPTTRLRLQKLQLSLSLSPADVAHLEQQVNDEMQSRQVVRDGNLTLYRQEFADAIAIQPVPPKPRRDRLQQLQIDLGLRDVDIIQAEAEVIRQNHLRQYEQAFSQRLRPCLQPPFPVPGEAFLEQIRQDLQSLQAALMLNDTDVALIQRQLAAQVEAQRQHYRQKLRHYGEEYARVVQQSFPPSLELRQQVEGLGRSLQLRDQDARNVERIVEQHWQTAQQQTAQQTTPPTSTDPATAQPSPAAPAPEDPPVAASEVPPSTEAAAGDPPTAALETPPSTEVVAGDAPAAVDPLATEPSTAEQPAEQPAAEPSPAAPPAAEQLEDGPGVEQPASQFFDPPPASAAATPPLPAVEPALEEPEAQVMPPPPPDSPQLDTALPPAPPNPVPPPPENPPSPAPAPDPTPPPPGAASARADDLSSERGIDYTTLRELLSLSQWREADQLTFQLMLDAANRRQAGWLNAASLDSFPCTDLNTLNQLWYRYSNARFGFSVQHKIYSNLNKPKMKVPQLALEFGKAVQWVMAGKVYPIFKPYEQLDFSLRAHGGHLPARWFWVLPALEAIKSGSPGLGRGLAGNDNQGMLAALMKRMSECNLQDK